MRQYICAIQMARFLKYALLAFATSSIYAIEGQEPSPRFLPPDFSVEEERVTYPGDLIEFFKDPFLQYLKKDSSGAIYNPMLFAGTDKGLYGSFKHTAKNRFVEARGYQLYLGDDVPEPLSRMFAVEGGYSYIALDRYPVAGILSAQYASFRKEYYPQAYKIEGFVEGHIPVLSSLSSIRLGGVRENWEQRLWFFPKHEPRDTIRTQIANTIKGNVAFRSMPGENTGFMVNAWGLRKTRYRDGFWMWKYQILSGKLVLIYDSKPMKLEIGGSAHKTWSEFFISPALDFTLSGEKFSLTANVDGYADVPDEWAFDSCPKSVLPKNIPYLKSPLAISVKGQLELKPGQIFFGEASIANIQGEPIVWHPLAESPVVTIEDVSHQTLSLVLSNDFNNVKNILAIEFHRNVIGDYLVPTIPSRTLTDSVSVALKNGVVLKLCAAQRMGLPDRGSAGEDDIALGATYKYDRYTFSLTLSNILQEEIFDVRSLEFDNNIKLRLGVSAEF
jgi:hypothetical protein